MSATSDDDGEDRESELVDQIMLDQHAIELSGPIFDDVLPRLFLQLGDLIGDIALNDLSVPGRRRECSRSYQLRKAIDTIEVRVALHLCPGGRELLIGLAT
jgi:hypothetical protein